MSGFSDYIVYTSDVEDEQLDVLQFCIFDKRHYAEVVVPKIQQFKFKHFGHDGVVFGIEGARGINQKSQWLNDIHQIIEHTNFILISCVLDKHGIPEDAFQETKNKALEFGVVHTRRFLEERDQVSGLSHFIAKPISPEIDEQKQIQFRQICEQHNNLPFELFFTDEKSLPLGLQFSAALIPSIIDQQKSPQSNSAGFNALTTKFYCKGGRKNVGEGYEGWGLKRFPE